MTDNVIFLNDVRLSFPHLKEPHASAANATPKYSGDFLLPPDHPGYAEFMRIYGELAMGKWGEHAQQVMGMIQQDRKLRCYGAGEEKVNKKTFQPYDGYGGLIYFTASRENPPQMIKPDGSAVDPLNTMEYQALARSLYGGCYVNAAVKPWIQDNAHGRGVRLDLVAVQFNRDGEAFGEGETDASGMFGAAQAAPAAAGTPAPQPQAAPMAPAPVPGQPVPAAAPQGMPPAPYPPQGQVAPAPAAPAASGAAPMSPAAPMGVPGMPEIPNQ